MERLCRSTLITECTNLEFLRFRSVAWPVVAEFQVTGTLEPPRFSAKELEESFVESWSCLRRIGEFSVIQYRASIAVCLSDSEILSSLLCNSMCVCADATSPNLRLLLFLTIPSVSFSVLQWVILPSTSFYLHIWRVFSEECSQTLSHRTSHSTSSFSNAL